MAVKWRTDWREKEYFQVTLAYLPFTEFFYVSDIWFYKVIPQGYRLYFKDEEVEAQKGYTTWKVIKTGSNLSFWF